MGLSKSPPGVLSVCFLRLTKCCCGCSGVAFRTVLPSCRLGRLALRIVMVTPSATRWRTGILKISGENEALLIFAFFTCSSSCHRYPSFQIVLFRMRFFCICPPPRRQLSAFLDAFLTKCHPHPRQNTYFAFSKIAKPAQMVPVGLPFGASFGTSDALSALQKHCFLAHAFHVKMQKLIGK